MLWQDEAAAVFGSWLWLWGEEGMSVRMGTAAMVMAMALVAGEGVGQVAVAPATAPAVRLVLTLKGRGVQIYNCQKRPGEAAAWMLRAPDAELLDGSWNDAAGEAGEPAVGEGPVTVRPDVVAGGDSLAASTAVAEGGSAAATGAKTPGIAAGAVGPADGYSVAAEEVGKVVGHHSAGPVWRLEDGSAVHGVVVSKKEAPETGAIPWLVLKATEPSGQGQLTGVVEIRREATHGGVAPATGCTEATVGVEQRVPYTAMYRFMRWGGRGLFGPGCRRRTGCYL